PRLGERFFFKQGCCGLYSGCFTADDEVFGRKFDRNIGSVPQRLYHLLPVAWKDRHHQAAWTIFVGGSPGVDKAQCACERQSADVNKVVVFTETQTQGSIGPNAFRSQPFAENVGSEKDTELNIAIVRKHLRVGGTIV